MATLMNTPGNLPPLAPHQVVAHRGDQRHCPENSPLAIEQAILQGAVHVEIDVQFSADGVPLLYHDDTLERLSGQPGKLSQFHFRALQTLTAGEPSRLGNRFAEVTISPLTELARLLRQYPQVQAYVELKEEAVRDYGAGFCLPRIREALADTFPRCTLISFDHEALREATGYGFRRLGPVLRDWSRRDEIADELEAEVVFCNYKRLPVEGKIGMDHCAVALYEIDELALAHQLLARGANLIETFCCGTLLGTRP